MKFLSKNTKIKLINRNTNLSDHFSSSPNDKENAKSYIIWMKLDHTVISKIGL